RTRLQRRGRVELGKFGPRRPHKPQHSQDSKGPEIRNTALSLVNFSRNTHVPKASVTIDKRYGDCQRKIAIGTSRPLAKSKREGCCSEARRAASILRSGEYSTLPLVPLMVPSWIPWNTPGTRWLA